MPIVRNGGAGILRTICSHWSGSSLNSREPRSPMYYIGVYAAVSINQFFEGPDLITSSRTKVTGVGSFLCHGFCKIVSYFIDEKALSSLHSAGIYSVCIVAASSRCIILTTNQILARSTHQPCCIRVCCIFIFHVFFMLTICVQGS